VAHRDLELEDDFAIEPVIVWGGSSDDLKAEASGVEVDSILIDQILVSRNKRRLSPSQP
jgi:hypothetical protein